MQLLRSNPNAAATLFAGWEETMLWSCLQGIMGNIYADQAEHPSCAMACLGDFCFFAGKPQPIPMKLFPGEFRILVPQHPGWEKQIEQDFGPHIRPTVRYATQKDPTAFQHKLLRKALEALPDGYELRRIDKDLYQRCLQLPWCRDFVVQYPEYPFYRQYGLGVVMLHQDEIRAGASSYSSYQGGIEIEVDTLPAFRRQGLAYLCCAKLISDCLDRGWYPSWDAQNLESLALAQKLGYRFSHTYPVYEYRRRS